MNIQFNKFRWILMVVLFGIISQIINSCIQKPVKTDDETPGVAVLLIDTDRSMGKISKNIYGQFLEHINHSVVDGLYAELVRGQGFEGDDFKNYWDTFSENGNVNIEDLNFKNGEKSVRINVNNGTAGIRQGRFYMQGGYRYDGSVWMKPEKGFVTVSLKVKGSGGGNIAEQTLETSGNEWQEVPYDFKADTTDTAATLEISATGNGSVLVDFISMMLKDARENGMLRPDLFKALDDLKPAFIRWPGGSYASVYKWKDGIGSQVSRKYHPNKIWGGYSDYYGFGTEEFMGLCKRLGADPMVVLPATTTDPGAVQYAIDWVHYLFDPATTEWGKQRAANGHPEPYDVPYIQIDNEPMNHGLSPDQYAEIVNVYGSRIRKIAPQVKIVACGQKRSTDMNWSEKLVDIAGDNFDIIGCHNYEYEPDKYKTGVRRIEEYLMKLRNYILKSAHPGIKIAILEWNLCRTYDWRAGMHAAGNLISYEKLGSELEFSCPALLMRNTSDDPTWTAWIYHNHVSWFPGGGYVVEKLFREHYTEMQYASTSGTFRQAEDPFTNFIDSISQFKPRDWRPGTVDAIATGSADGKRIVIKAVNYEGINNTLITRIQGSKVPEKATVKIYTIRADKKEKASLKEPDKIKPVESSMPYEKDMKIALPPYSVMVLEIDAS